MLDANHYSVYLNDWSKELNCDCYDVGNGDDDYHDGDDYHDILRGLNIKKGGKCLNFVRCKWK
jgi:hypothetical protein